MKNLNNANRLIRWTLLVASIVAVAGLTWIFTQTRILKGQAGSGSTAGAVQPSPVFTTEHSSLAEAVRHFFNIRPTPQQPIAYTHQVHVVKAQLQCAFCHVGVEKGPVASIPGVTKCMECHEFVATDKPEIQKIADYQKRGEEIPWQRVYGWVEESHVRFNHAPHIRAKVECVQCHGDVPNMTVAERVVDHTMGFCVRCHEQRKASNDCLTCHY